MYRFAVLLLASLLILSSPSIAGRAPNIEEREKVEAVLKKEGFVKWGEIEFEDDAWHVEDAQAPDGREYDLTLDSQSLEITERIED
jgi:hypothetical protein